MVFNLRDIIKESVKLFEGRKEDALAKYGEVPKDIFDIFVEDDPSGNHKYIDWLMKVWGQDNCGANGGYYNDYRCTNTGTATKLMEDIKFFNEQPHKYDSKDINSYTTIRNFSTNTVDARLKLTKGELKKQAKKIFETDRYLVVEPDSHASSCYYGAGTQWCTTAKNYSNHFDSYYKNNSLFYFINKKTGKKRAFLSGLKKPMFGPSRYGNTDWVHAGDKEYRNYAGQIYTETDRLGRSFAGVPVQARESMQLAHIEKAKKYIKSISDSPEKIRIMRQLGMDDVPELTIIDGNWSTNTDGPIPPTVKTINGNFKVSNNGDMGNVEEVNGELYLGNEVTSVTSIKTCQSIAINNRVSLTSLIGRIDIIKLVSDNAIVVDWGGITSIGNLWSYNLARGWKRMVNSIPIDVLTFSRQSAKLYLEKSFAGKTININNYM